MVRAAEPTDEIEHFLITVDVQEDASLLMTYHIDWKVLDDQEYGPLEWVNIGVPNAHHSDVTARSSNISRIEDKGSTLAIYLDRSYYEDEVASFEFSFVQDHMYQIDRFAEGETAFIYTPAWFDGIEVQDLTIRWNADKAGAWQPECVQDNGYLVFSASLGAGERYSLTVAYPNDAFAFSVDRQADEAYGNNGGSEGSYSGDAGWEDIVFGLIAVFIIILLFVVPIILIFKGDDLAFLSTIILTILVIIFIKLFKLRVSCEFSYNFVTYAFSKLSNSHCFASLTCHHQRWEVIPQRTPLRAFRLMRAK